MNLGQVVDKVMGNIFKKFFVRFGEPGSTSRFFLVCQTTTFNQTWIEILSILLKCLRCLFHQGFYTFCT